MIILIGIFIGVILERLFVNQKPQYLSNQNYSDYINKIL